MEDEHDAGHEALMEDVTMLYNQCKDYDYHDFLSPHSTPKMMLKAQLEQMIQSVINGDYDN